ncbi:valine--tRNA ligase [Pontibaca salina]|uniref:Valine--tRNA ligase n=1 Tax=Pontibaca salina TaxID=2795731 RepID=A0A934HMA7_9RHOB|nr:valine--tRNA ligase [Pontibaca salina]MBI6629536.1 valine--tRNA ligase [Pontibaca salina]
MAMEKTFDAAEAEGRLYRAWEEAGCFTAGANASRSETYCIMIPPPNVTGSLHMGHAFNNTLQDILIRWHRMRGFDTLWQPGQDHAGIATQMVVERKLAEEGSKGRRELGREAFIDKVWEWKEESGGAIVNQLKRLGASLDWSRDRFTMDKGFHAAVLKVFVDLYDKGIIYRGKRLVNWDPHFETAISDLEVENIEVPGHMWHFKYPLAGGETYTYVEKDEDGTVVLEEERDYISIATTRPETMLGDGAVAVHPSDSRYAPIVGKLCEIPVGPKDQRRLIPIIADEYPDPDFGSGAVKITGAHDFNDYAVAMRNGIPLYALMDTKGAMRSDGLPYGEAAAWAQGIAEGRETAPQDASRINLVPEEYRGLDRFEARERIVADINAEGLAVTVTNDDGETVPFVENKPIMQPFGDRSKVVVEPMLTDQWFVDTAQIVGPALDAVRDGEVTILPERDKKVYYHWLENIEPWCISRQLWWGHQIPVWYGLDLSAPEFRDDEGDGELDLVELHRLLIEGGMLHAGAVEHCAADFESVQDAFRDEIADTPTPINHAAIVEVKDKHEAIHLLAESLAHYGLEQDPTKLVYPVWRDPDVLDTWFSSGLWPIGTLGWPDNTPELQKYFPTNTLVTGFDIIFFWVARMMMMQYAVVGQKPFDTVYVHALVRDQAGKKMSKSLGNVIDPLDLIDEYGADAVRFTLTAMAAMGRDLKLSTQRVAGYRNFGTKLWNAMRFAEMNEVFGVSATERPQPSKTLNRWIIGEVAKTGAEVDEALSNFRFNDAANTLYAFVWHTVCDWYVEFSKPLLQSEDAEARDETRATMKWVLDQCLILLHPIMPFITEELWALSGKRDKMLIHGDWPEYTPADLVDPEADHEMNWVITLIENVRSARAQMHVPAGAHVPMLVREIDARSQSAWERNETLIKRLARIESLERAETFPKGTVTVAVPGGVFGLPLAGIIDIDKEKSRLEKSLGKLEKELGGLRGRLNNPKFASSAPPEVVEETRANLAAREAEETKLREALARLSELE